MTRTTLDIWLCSDCGMLTANGTDGWGLDAAGVELGELHAARMRIWQAGIYTDLVVSGCDDPCDYAGNDDSEHDCRFDQEFSRVQCDGCGTPDAGYRFAAVEFLRA